MKYVNIAEVDKGVIMVDPEHMQYFNEAEEEWLDVPALSKGEELLANVKYRIAVSDYDMSIHSNPDAKAWAAEFKKRFPDADEELMHTWFANAMMAMSDYKDREHDRQHAAMNDD